MGLNLNRADVMQVHQVIGECEELWNDPPAWQDHVAASLEAIAGASSVSFVVVQGHRSEIAFAEGRVTHSDDSGVRRLFSELLREGAPLFPAYPVASERLLAEGWCTATFSELVASTDDSRGASEFVERFMRPNHAERLLYSAARTAAGPVAAFALLRSRTERDFSARDRDFATVLTAAVAARCETRLTMQCQPGIHKLSKRQREVLGALLEGDSEKQVAARLGLSSPTVHEYVVALYRLYRVHSRGELMALFVRNAPVPAAHSGGMPTRSDSSAARVVIRARDR
jgi:DNA-binding CsgD family transcriptional regulator